MVGKIPYDVYSELFDVGTDCIQEAYELGKSEFEAQVEKMKCCRNCKYDGGLVCLYKTDCKNRDRWELAD